MGEKPLVANRNLVALILAAVAVVSGCSKGPDLVPVSGKITLNGKPLPFGLVIFQPSNGQLSQGEITNGEFKMSTRSPGDGATVGLQLVSIVCYEANDPAKKAQFSGPQTSLGRCLVHNDYTRSGTSGLSVTVPPEGKTDVVFELSSKGPAR
jgi:hypothetical protein